MKKPILLDTCIIIDFLRKKEKAISFIQALEEKPFISAITITELLIGVRNNRERKEIEIILNNATILEVSEEVATYAGNLLNKYYKSHGVGLGDGLIAATAKVYDLDVATKNIKHFPMFDGIEKPY